MSGCGGCGTDCSLEEAKPTIQDPKSITIRTIQNLFVKEGPAVNYASSHDIYLAMLKEAPFYVSPVHSRDGNKTWWAAAVDKEAYDEWEKHVEHQHHPQDEHPHYLGLNEAQYANEI